MPQSIGDGTNNVNRVPPSLNTDRLHFLEELWKSQSIIMAIPSCLFTLVQSYGFSQNHPCFQNQKAHVFDECHDFSQNIWDLYICPIWHNRQSEITAMFNIDIYILAVFSILWMSKFRPITGMHRIYIQYVMTSKWQYAATVLQTW